MKKVNLNIRPLIHEVAFSTLKNVTYTETIAKFEKKRIDATKAFLKKYKGNRLLNKIQVKYGVNRSTARQAVLNEERK